MRLFLYAAWQFSIYVIKDDESANLSMRFPDPVNPEAGTVNSYQEVCYA